MTAEYVTREELKKVRERIMLILEQYAPNYEVYELVQKWFDTLKMNPEDTI